MTCCEDKKYPSHEKEIKSLNRVSGQVEGLKKMIQERRYCPDIINQIKAVRAALKTVETNILKAHLNDCVIDSFSGKSKKDQQKKIEELTEIFKRFS